MITTSVPKVFLHVGKRIQNICKCVLFLPKIAKQIEIALVNKFGIIKWASMISYTCPYVRCKSYKNIKSYEKITNIFVHHAHFIYLMHMQSKD